MLHKRFGEPNHVFVPALECGKKTSHARMFQTVSLFAAKYNLEVNTTFDEKATLELSREVPKKKGTVRIAWEHKVIDEIENAVGVDSPEEWPDPDFD